MGMNRSRMTFKPVFSDCEELRRAILEDQFETALQIQEDIDLSTTYSAFYYAVRFGKKKIALKLLNGAHPPKRHEWEIAITRFRFEIAFEMLQAGYEIHLTSDELIAIGQHIHFHIGTEGANKLAGKILQSCCKNRLLDIDFWKRKETKIFQKLGLIEAKILMETSFLVFHQNLLELIASFLFLEQH